MGKEPSPEPLLPLTGPILNEMLLKHGMSGSIPPVDQSKLLDNDIDPVFQRSNWVLGVDENNVTCDIDGPLFKVDAASEAEMDILWKMLIPSFRLATKLIRHENLQEFWVKSVEAYKEQIPKQYAALSPKDVACEYLDLLASRTTFMFGIGNEPNIVASTWNSNTGLRISVMRTMGAMGAMKAEFMKSYGETQRELPAYPVIGLNLKHARLLLLAHQKKLARDQRLKLNFHIAIALCHELAHAFHNLCRLSGDKERRVFGNDSVTEEAGYSWEIFALGGVISQYRYSESASLYIGPMSVLKQPMDRRHIFFVPLEWILRLFLNSTWDNFEESKQNGFLNFRPLSSDKEHPVLELEGWNSAGGTKKHYILKEHGEVVEEYEETIRPRRTS